MRKKRSYGAQEDSFDRGWADRWNVGPPGGAERARRHRPFRYHRRRAAGQGARPGRGDACRERQRETGRRERLFRDRRRRRGHCHRRSSTQARNEPRRPARHQSQGYGRGRRGDPGAREARFRYLHHQSPRCHGVGAAEILWPADQENRGDGGRTGYGTLPLFPLGGVQRVARGCDRLCPRRTRRRNGAVRPLLDRGRHPAAGPYQDGLDNAGKNRRHRRTHSQRRRRDCQSVEDRLGVLRAGRFSNLYGRGLSQGSAPRAALRGPSERAVWRPQHLCGRAGGDRRQRRRAHHRDRVRRERKSHVRQVGRLGARPDGGRQGDQSRPRRLIALSARSRRAFFFEVFAAMNIHEYQAKAVLRAFGVPIASGFPAFTPDEAVDGARKLPGPLWVVKSQIHAGGRGKVQFKEAAAGDKGGVRLARSVDEVQTFATQILGATLVTAQTGPHGKQVNRLYIEDGATIDRELYLSALVDRQKSRVAFVLSTEGGVNIEDVAHNTPEKIHSFTVDPATGIMPHHGRAAARALELTVDLAKQTESLIAKLYAAFLAKDMSMLEINPLVVLSNGQLRVLDAKVSFDDNALYRHPDIAALRDESEEDAKEIEASKHDLNYVTLEGSIGCMVNGAGLAMATMDIIKLYGESPANFLDVGGGASKDKVAAAFKIITADPNVKGILVNIFGGIMRCDIIAEGVIAAVKEVGLQVPLVVRLEGTNVDLGKKILRESGLDVIPADDLDDAAQKIVSAVRARS